MNTGDTVIGVVGAGTMGNAIPHRARTNYTYHSVTSIHLVILKNPVIPV